MELLFQDREHDWTAWVIRFVTGSRYHHCALRADGWIWEATQAGHERQPLRAIDQYQTIQAVPGDEAAAVIALTAHLGDRYSYVDGAWGALFSVFRITWGQLPWTTTVASNCSHYAALGLVAAGDRLPEPLPALTPGDLARWAGVESPCTNLRERFRRARGE